MTSRPIIACGFSANMEFVVPHRALLDPLPEGIKSNKNAGCLVEKRREGEKTRFVITLPKKDKVHIDLCNPHTFYAGSSVNIGSMALALGADVHCWLTLGKDEDGKETYQFLGEKGIKVNNIECGQDTPRTVAVCGDGVTTLLMQKPGPPQYSLGKDIQEQVIGGIERTQPDIIFMTSIGETELTLARKVLESQTQPFRVFCPRISILGGGREHTIDLLCAMAVADAVFMNRREFRHFTEQFDVDCLFRSREHLPLVVNKLAPMVNDERPRLFVVTCDTDGASAIMHCGGKVKGIHDVLATSNIVPADTTGAGDAFALGMTLGIYHKTEWQSAMGWGAKLAEANILGPGGWWAADKTNNEHPLTPAFFDPPTT